MNQDISHRLATARENVRRKAKLVAKIQSAKLQAHEAHQAILHFQQELADTGHNLQASLQIDGFSKFADIFFDGIMMDWMMQSNIQRASTACSETIAKVQLAMRRCDDRLASVRREHQALTEERVRLIEATELLG